MLLFRLSVLCLALLFAGIASAETPKRAAEAAAMQKVRDEYRRTKDPHAALRSVTRLAEGDGHNFLAYVALIKFHGLKGDPDLVRHYARCAARYQFASGEAGDPDLLKAAEEDAIAEIIVRCLAETPVPKR